MSVSNCPLHIIMCVFYLPSLKVWQPWQRLFSKGGKYAGNFFFHQSTSLQMSRPLSSIINALSQRSTLMMLFESHLASGWCKNPLSKLRSGRKKFFFSPYLFLLSLLWTILTPASSVTISHRQSNSPEHSL